jgi:hypothetical protein
MVGKYRCLMSIDSLWRLVPSPAVQDIFCPLSKTQYILVHLSTHLTLNLTASKTMPNATACGLKEPLLPHPPAQHGGGRVTGGAFFSALKIYLTKT